MSVWFITPAWQRFDLSAVCFEQRRRVMARLAEQGIEARCVVVADDDNLDIARALGFDTVERDNEWLGRRYNDGIEYAIAHGATWAVPIGADSWIDPDYFVPLPPDEAKVVRTSQLYAPVEMDRLAVTRVRHRTNPAGPHMFHRGLLRKAHNRPMPDKIRRDTDSLTVKTLMPYRYQYRDVQTLQYIGFRAPPFITQYDTLVRRWGKAEHRKPWELLAQHYDADLVDGAKAAMSKALEVAA